MASIRLFAAALLVFALSGAGSAQGPRRGVGENVPLPPPEESDAREVGIDDRFALSIDVNLVNVDVVVTDDDDNPISGLTREHFKIFVEDQEQPITNFRPTDAPLTVVLLIEFGDTFAYYYDDVVAPAAGFINSLREDDWAAIVAYDLRPEILTDFTQNPDELYNGLNRLRFPAYRETALFDAVNFTLDRLENIDGKKAIFLLSSGFDTISRANYGETLDRVETSDTMIYAVGMGGLFRAVYESQLGALDRVSFLQAELALRSMAEATGGMSFQPRFQGEYPGIYETVSLHFRNQYSLGFIPTGLEADDDLLEIEVEVAPIDVDGDGEPEDLKVRHKKGFYLNEAEN